MRDAADLIPFKSILHLSDFSPCSENGLRWAVAVARAHQAKLSVLHVVIPRTFTSAAAESPSLDIKENSARSQMAELEKRLADVPLETFVQRDDSVWPSVSVKLAELSCDLLVVGTHGSTGFGKLFLGSVAETVLRQSPIPVMTIGAATPPPLEGKFQRVLVATNLRARPMDPASFGVALARRERARLFLLHTCKAGGRGKAAQSSELSVAEALHRLHDLATSLGNGNDDNPPQSIVEFGDAKTKILEVATRTKADLIVTGVAATRNVAVARHVEMGTAHAIVAHAMCPVLTVPECAVRRFDDHARAPN